MSAAGDQLLRYISLENFASTICHLKTVDKMFFIHTKTVRFSLYEFVMYTLNLKYVYKEEIKESDKTKKSRRDH